MLDLSSDFGKHVARRLEQEHVIWLVTVRADLTPQPSPVWFLWDGETFLIYSQPDKQKLRNITRHPEVALHLNSDGQGGDIVVITGQARIERSTPPANQVPAYAGKYRQDIQDINFTPESFAGSYSVPIRISPDNLRGHR